MRRVPVVLIGALWGVFALCVLGASRSPVSDQAAFNAWLIHDATPIRAAAPQDVARAVLAHWRASIDRMQGAGGLRADLLALKGWTTLFGDLLASVAVARGLLFVLTAAFLYRLILRRMPWGGVTAARLPVIRSQSPVSRYRSALARTCCIVTGNWKRTAFDCGIGAALVLAAAAASPLLSPLPDYHPALTALAEQRALTEPVLTVFRPDSPLGYHHAQASLRPGIGIDLGWRAFASEELSASLDGLRGDVVWVLGDTGLSRTLSLIHDILLSEGRTRDLCIRPTSRVLLARYVVSGGADACA